METRKDNFSRPPVHQNWFQDRIQVHIEFERIVELKRSILDIKKKIIPSKVNEEKINEVKMVQP
jgi:hypothetical protein